MERARGSSQRGVGVKQLEAEDKTLHLLSLSFFISLSLSLSLSLYLSLYLSHSLFLSYPLSVADSFKPAAYGVSRPASQSVSCLFSQPARQQLSNPASTVFSQSGCCSCRSALVFWPCLRSNLALLHSGSKVKV